MKTLIAFIVVVVSVSAVSIALVFHGHWLAGSILEVGLLCAARVGER